MLFFFCKQKTAYEMRISDWSSDVCSSDLCACAAATACTVVTGGPPSTCPDCTLKCVTTRALSIVWNTAWPTLSPAPRVSTRLPAVSARPPPIAGTGSPTRHLPLHWARGVRRNARPYRAIVNTCRPTYPSAMSIPLVQLAPEPDAPFPPARTALNDPDGLLAVGGDLSATRLLSASRNGIFPWFGEGQPILWWSPEQRCVFHSGQVHLSSRFRRSLRHREWRLD